MYICVVVSSIGRNSSFDRLLQSLAAQNEKAFEVGVCDQSENGIVSSLVDEYRTRLNISVVRTGRGLSRGRNAVIANASSNVTHFVFPNDSSVLSPDFMSNLYARHQDADVVALSYVHDGTPRYKFPAGTYPLNLNNVWKIIEPGMVLSKRVLEVAGGFDERLGTGCNTPWQSGEGTDLLLRLTREKLVMKWDPDIGVEGVSQAYGLGPRERRRKLRSYGRGYGYVLTRWKYPFSKRIKCVFGPFAQFLSQTHQHSLLDAAYSSLGRAEGLMGAMWQRGDDNDNN